MGLGGMFETWELQQAWPPEHHVCLERFLRGENHSSVSSEPDESFGTESKLQQGNPLGK